MIGTNSPGGQFCVFRHDHGAVFEITGPASRASVITGGKREFRMKQEIREFIAMMNLPDMVCGDRKLAIMQNAEKLDFWEQPKTLCSLPQGK